MKIGAAATWFLVPLLRAMKTMKPRTEIRQGAGAGIHRIVPGRVGRRVGLPHRSAVSAMPAPMPTTKNTRRGSPQRRPRRTGRPGAAPVRGRVRALEP